MTAACVTKILVNWRSRFNGFAPEEKPLRSKPLKQLLLPSKW
jgi:hypothetical protein